MAISLVVNGIATTLSFDDVALPGDDLNTITDDELKARVARYYDQPEGQYDDYVVDRYPGDGAEVNFVLRRKAVYG